PAARGVCCRVFQTCARPAGIPKRRSPRAVFPGGSGDKPKSRAPRPPRAPSPDPASTVSVAEPILPGRAGWVCRGGSSRLRFLHSPNDLPVFVGFLFEPRLLI